MLKSLIVNRSRPKESARDSAPDLSQRVTGSHGESPGDRIFGDDIPTAERLLELIETMEGKPVPVVADLVADRFITGTPKRISREAPVLILTWDGESLVPGGGANAVANIAALGGTALPVGWVGDDDNGHALRRALEERGVETTGILVHPDYRTPTKTRILGGGRHTIKQQIVRYDIEDAVSPTPAQRDELRSALREILRRQPEMPSVTVLSDYGYGAVDPEWIETLRTDIGAATTILCDSRYRLDSFHGLDGATPNAEEAEALYGGPLGAPGSGLEAAGDSLRRQLDARFLLVTRGSEGMTLLDGREPPRAIHLPVHGTDQVADVTGAGDTVIGTFALALAAGAEPLEAALLANYAGGVVVMKMGTATLTRDELRQAIDSDPNLPRRTRWASC